jgi:hypothetical protein
MASAGVYEGDGFSFFVIRQHFLLMQRGKVRDDCVCSSTGTFLPEIVLATRKNSLR